MKDNIKNLCITFILLLGFLGYVSLVKHFVVYQFDEYKNCEEAKAYKDINTQESNDYIASTVISTKELDRDWEDVAITNPFSACSDIPMNSYILSATSPTVYRRFTGLKPDKTGHWPSREPKTGQILIR
jgi:hypothetical protein